ncbi:MAG: polysaccharide biosynthesis tyrosine autokinase, partial [Acidimicrobiia bacterium]|nr:polysaccharide biosynthesis tyrosine autokinase [Acidimicrobiia bacterium]
ARDLAQSSALAYLSFRRDEATAGAADSRARLEAREAELLAALAAIGTGSSTAEADQATADPAAAAQAIDTVPTAALPYAAVAKRQELVSIGSTYANLEALAIDPGVVLTDAALPATTTGLPLYAGPVTGLMLGLIGALTAVFVLDRTDDRLRSSRVELSALGVPVLGNAPVAAKRGGLPGSTGVYPVNSPAGDAYRRLQGSLLFTLEHDSRSVVLVAGVTSAAAATTVAANVAVTAARAGRRTLVVGADLRRNQLTDRFKLPAGKGLSDVVLDGASLADSIQGVPGVENLSVLGAGTRLDRPADVLQSESLARLLAAVEADFDLVIVEAAPVLEVADAVDIAPLCHGSVVVVDAAVETRAAIADSVGQLRSVGADVVGVVVADADR